MAPFKLTSETHVGFQSVPFPSLFTQTTYQRLPVGRSASPLFLKCEIATLLLSAEITPVLLFKPSAFNLDSCLAAAFPRRWMDESSPQILGLGRMVLTSLIHVSVISNGCSFFRFAAFEPSNEWALYPSLFLFLWSLGDVNRTKFLCLSSV